MAISIDDIKGPNCLETWLRERPEGVRQNGAVFIAARSALRVLPIAVDTCQFGQRAIERGVTAVPALLGLLIASVSTKDLTMDLAEKAESMSQSHWDIFSISSVEHAYAAWITALSAAYIHVFGGQKDEEGEPGVLLAPISADSNAYAWSNAIIEKFEASRAAIDQDVSGDDRTAARNTVDTTLALADASQRVCWDFVREDCRLWLANAADDGTCAIDVAPLRIDAVGVDPDWPTLREKLLNDGDPDRGADWSFWVDWYNKILGGDPQDWDMLHEIAVSDGIDWQASPRAVTAAIARIVQKHRLLNEIGDLKSHLDQFRASAEVRSHNMPPELLEDLVEETQSIQIIWDQLDEAEDQLNKSAPDPSKLHKIGTVLRNTVTVVAKYSVHKTDEMVTESLKKIGAVGGVVIVASYAEIIERVQAFGKSLLEFAKLILGG